MNQLKPYQFSAINAISLVLIGGYGYIQSETPSPTALIPVIIGALLLLMNGGIKSENKLVAHIAVTLTLLILFGLTMPMLGAIERGDNFAIMRCGIMIVTSVAAMASFIISFINARKKD